MKTLAFYGASDDLFLAGVDGKCVEELCDSTPDAFMAYVVHSRADSGMLIVTAQYGLTGGGTWVIGVTQASEDFALPSWPIRIENQPPDGTNDRPYSPRLIIEAPDDVTITEMVA